MVCPTRFKPQKHRSHSSQRTIRTRGFSIDPLVLPFQCTGMHGRIRCFLLIKDTQSGSCSYQGSLECSNVAVWASTLLRKTGSKHPWQCNVWRGSLPMLLPRALASGRTLVVPYTISSFWTFPLEERSCSNSECCQVLLGAQRCLARRRWKLLGGSPWNVGVSWIKENETFPLGMYEYLTVRLVPKQLLEGVHLLHPRATELGAAPHPPSRTASTVQNRKGRARVGWCRIEAKARPRPPVRARPSPCLHAPPISSTHSAQLPWYGRVLPASPDTPASDRCTPSFGSDRSWSRPDAPFSSSCTRCSAGAGARVVRWRRSDRWRWRTCASGRGVGASVRPEGGGAGVARPGRAWFRW